MVKSASDTPPAHSTRIVALRVPMWIGAKNMRNQHESPGASVNHVEPLKHVVWPKKSMGFEPANTASNNDTGSLETFVTVTFLPTPSNRPTPTWPKLSELVDNSIGDDLTSGAAGAALTACNNPAANATANNI